MNRLAVRLAACLAFAFAPALAAGRAHAVPVTAELIAGEGCLTQGCTDGSYRWRLPEDTIQGGGSGSLDLTGGTLTFSITVPGESFLPTAPWGYDAGGVTQLDFTDLAYTGSAAMEYDGAFGIDNWYVSQGTGTVAGFLTPTGAGSAGPFVGTTALGLNPLVEGSCRGAGGAIQVCNITIGAYTSFGVDVNGEERWFSHGVRMTVSAPEPTPVLLVEFGALVLSRQRRRA